jgi:K+-transporting ATPase A subunit
VTYYLLLPICLIFALFLVSQGIVQNFHPYTTARVVEPFKISLEKKNENGQTVLGSDGKPVMEEQTVTEQVIAQGPVASQVAIKMLGTNGGGFFNANDAHPFENPTPLSNFFQMLSIFSIGSGLTYYLGRMVRNQKHGWALWSVMTALFLGGVLLAWWAQELEPGPAAVSPATAPVRLPFMPLFRTNANQREFPHPFLPFSGPRQCMRSRRVRPPMRSIPVEKLTRTRVL